MRRAHFFFACVCRPALDFDVRQRPYMAHADSRGSVLGGDTSTTPATISGCSVVVTRSAAWPSARYFVLLSTTHCFCFCQLPRRAAIVVDIACARTRASSTSRLPLC